jgi:ISXO2-like transposase domain
MLERDASQRLTGRIEIDDAYLGGERSGGRRGRGAPGKTPFIAAVETTTEGKPVRLKLRRVTSFCATAIAGFAKRSLDPNCSVVSDGLQRRPCLPGSSYTGGATVPAQCASSLSIRRPSMSTISKRQPS